MSDTLKKVRLDLYDKQGGRCFWCSKALVLPVAGHSVQKDDTATMDHLIPKSKGGRNFKSNFVVACAGCNRTRGCQYVNPSTGEPLFFVSTNLFTPDVPSKGFKLRDFALINYHEAPAF